MPIVYTALNTTKPYKNSLFVDINMVEVWKKENLRTKLKSLLRFKWHPTDEIFNSIYANLLMRDIGFEEDFGIAVLNMLTWHTEQNFPLDFLHEKDIERSSAITAMNVLLWNSYHEPIDSLRLKLFLYVPEICLLTTAMVVKIPILTIQYATCILADFAFNSIRKSKHQNADGLIDYLYEVLYLQQKTALTLLQINKDIEATKEDKGENVLARNEVEIVMNIDLSISYLKSSVEKILIILGLTHNITGLESKKQHKARIKHIENSLPPYVKELNYFHFIAELFNSNNLQTLNNYRTGLLHKKGISRLHPHSFVNIKGVSVGFRKIFDDIIEQHQVNTVCLICVLAILTDELVKLDPPEISVEELVQTFLQNKSNSLMKQPHNDGSESTVQD